MWLRVVGVDCSVDRAVVLLGVLDDGGPDLLGVVLGGLHCDFEAVFLSGCLCKWWKGDS